MKQSGSISLLFLFITLKCFAQTNSPAKISDVQYDFISINSIFMYFSNNGDMSFNPNTSSSGLEWPKGSGKTVTFEEGIVWGGRTQANTLRVGGSTYRHGLQPGKIEANGLSANQREKLPSGNARYRSYKVRKVTPTTYAALSSAERSRLVTDYLEWPILDGAPFTNRDGIMGYQPNFNI